MDNSTKPMVSVLMLAYNHEKYIDKALDSVLMQKVDFDYNIVVAEDCSTDNTRKVLFEYKQKYPDKIKLILNEKNIGMHENVNIGYRECLGKYCAVCEGDDYWIDPYKLKKQVSFLENNKDYIACTHKVEVIDENDKVKENFNYDIYCNDKEFTLKHASKGILPGQSATLVFRNIMSENQIIREEFEHCIANGDMKLSLLLVLNGKIYCFDEIMSRYRRVTDNGTSWNSITHKKNMTLYIFKSYKSLESMAFNLKQVKMDYKSIYVYQGLYSVKYLIKEPTFDNMKILLSLFKDYNLFLWLILIKTVLIYPFKNISKLRLKYEK